MLVKVRSRKCHEFAYFREGLECCTRTAYGAAPVLTRELSGGVASVDYETISDDGFDTLLRR